MISIEIFIKAIVKSTGLAGVLFWTLLLSDESWENEFPTFIIISIIPIFIICALAYTITILPIILIEKGKSTKNQIFKKYFPYYSIISFGICSFFILNSNFENVVVSFFTTAFFTSITTWIWLFKPQKNE